MSFRIVALLIFSFSWLLPRAQDTTALRYGNLVSGESMQRFLSVLSSDSLEGRETGKEGQKKAANYIASHFSRLGLAPVSHGGYFQHHPISVKNNIGKNIEVNQQYFLFGKD